MRGMIAAVRSAPVTGAPDLVVTAITWVPAAINAGDSVRFSATVANQGAGEAAPGTIIGVRFDVDGAIASWSDNYTGGLMPGGQVTVTANGGPGGNGGIWSAVAGDHTVQAWVDDVNRFPNETPKTNNTLTSPLPVAGGGGGTTLVATLAELTTALNRGDLDITITASITAPSGGVNIPRISGGRTLRCNANGIIIRGSTNGHVLRSDGSGGRLTLVGVRVDGGWRSNKHEGEDSESNYFLPDFTFLRLDGCVTAYSYRTGWFVAGCTQVEIENSVMFACPRDACWEPGVRDYLFRGNLIQHCGDDSWGSHQGSIGNNLVTKWILVENNTFRDGFGFKMHAGAASGTHNGKPSGITIRNNTFEAAGLYGLYFWEDFGNNEPWAPPRNITVEGNTWRDTRVTTRSSGGQRIGVQMLLGFPDTSYDASLVIRNNTSVRNASFNGQPAQNCYAWAQLNSPQKPQNVPGAGAFQGFFSKNGFQADEVFELASVGYRNDGGANQGAITHSGNVWTGSWTNTLA